MQKQLQNAVQLRKHSVEIVEKHHAHGVAKGRQNFTSKRSHQKLIPTFMLLSKLHQVQMNFTENSGKTVWAIRVQHFMHRRN